jgi:hypothetical protein
MYYATTFNQVGQEGQTPNSTYPIGGVSCSADCFVAIESVVLRMNICAENPPLRKAENR